jgi:hypothetical protein
MPFIDEELLDDEEQDGSQISASSQVIGSGTTAEQAANTAKKGSGQFANLDEYLRVNEPQAFGEKLAGKVGSDIDESSNAVQKANQEFQSRVDASKVTEDPDLVSRAVADPESVLNNDADRAQWEKRFNARYEGPNSLVDAADLFQSTRGATQTAMGKAGATKSEGGRFALLDNYFGKPDYTSGQKSLDNLLVQNDKQANDAFAQVRENAQNLARNQASKERELAEYAAGAKSATEAARIAPRQALGVDDKGQVLTNEAGQPDRGAIGSLLQRLNSDLGTKRSRYTQMTKNIRDAVASRDLSRLSAEELAMLDAGEIPGNLYGVDPSTYLSFSPEADINLSSATSKADARRLDALLGLSDLQNTYLDSSKAETAPSDYAQFDKERFQSDIGSRRQSFETSASQLQSEVEKMAADLNAARVEGGVAGADYEEMRSLIRTKWDQLNALRAQYGFSALPYPTILSAGLPESGGNL